MFFPLEFSAKFSILKFIFQFPLIFNSHFTNYYNSLIVPFKTHKLSLIAHIHQLINYIISKLTLLALMSPIRS